MRFHFIAIGGGAMHNLAIALHLNGHQVTGSDDGIFEPSLSRLIRYGLMPPATGWFPDKITEETDAVILGMHAHADNPELLEAQKINILVYSFPAFLYEHSKNKLRVIIAGSHGKTTTTAMIVHVLRIAGVDADFMIGDKLEGFEVMVRLTSSANYMIIEGDEYLTSPIDLQPKFLHYHPHIAVISGLAWDHLEAFSTFENYCLQFRMLMQSMEPDGILFYDKTDPLLKEMISEIGIYAYGYGEHLHSVENGITKVFSNDETSYRLQVFGAHNLKNLSAARLVCNELGVTDAVFYKAISTFKGVSRRMELLTQKNNSFIYRDFAHAPSKVSATAKALRQQYPEHTLIICYELRTFSSLSEIFIDQYKGTLNYADVAIAYYNSEIVRYKGLSLMSSERIKQGFSNNELQIFSDKDEMLSFVRSTISNPFVLAFLTPVNFDGLTVQEMKQLINFA